MRLFDLQVITIQGVQQFGNALQGDTQKPDE